jgi:cytosine/uracil/thiamine/allantoin permease
MKQKRYWLRGAVLFEVCWLLFWLVNLIISTNRHDALNTLLAISIPVVILGSILGWVYGKSNSLSLMIRSIGVYLTKQRMKKFFNVILIIIAVIAGIFIVLYSLYSLSHLSALVI